MEWWVYRIEGLPVWGLGVLRDSVEGASDRVFSQKGCDSGGVDAGSCEGVGMRVEVVLQSGPFGTRDAEREYVTAVFRSRQALCVSMCARSCEGIRTKSLSKVFGVGGDAQSGEEAGEVSGDEETSEAAGASAGLVSDFLEVFYFEVDGAKILRQKQVAR